MGRRYWPMVTMSTPDAAQVGEGAEHLGLGLAHADDEARLGGQAGRLGPGQHGQAAGVGGRGPHGPLQPGDRLEVVVEHLGAGVEDGAEGRRARPGSRGSGPRPRCPGQRRWMASMVAANAGRPAVGQVVAGHGGDHGVGQAHPGHRLGDPLRLARSTGMRLAGVDQAEPARPGAAVAVDHEGGGAVGPALEDVGQPASSHTVTRSSERMVRLQGPVLRPHLGLGPQPLRLALAEGRAVAGPRRPRPGGRAGAPACRRPVAAPRSQPAR